MQRRFVEKRVTVALLCGLLLSCGPAKAPREVEEPPSSSPPLSEEVLEQSGAPGLIWGVLRDDGVVEAWAAGVADVETGQSLDPGRCFYIGSVTKMYTAILVLKLVEDGTLSLDDGLDTYMPAFPGASGITLHQLLNHTSGLADFEQYIYMTYTEEDFVAAMQKDWTTEEMVTLAGTLDPLFEPGEGWEYSNTNYLLLALVVEAATHESYPAALRVRVLEPLDLEQTWLHRWEEPRGEVGATGYLSSLEFWPTSTMFGELGATTSLDSSNLGYGHSGLVSTLEDGLKLVSALMKGEVLETESMEAMQTFVPIKEAAPDKPSPGYGLGLFHVIRPGYDMTGHGGMFNGHTAGFWYLPGCETSVAMYANRGFIDEFPIYDRLVDDLGCAVE